MGSERVVRVEEFDRMTPQERADAVIGGIARSWDDVRPDLKVRLEERATDIELARGQLR